jgi:Fe2+ or Zn2+ uptake regulation protein
VKKVPPRASIIVCPVFSSVPTGRRHSNGVPWFDFFFNIANIVKTATYCKEFAIDNTFSYVCSPSTLRKQMHHSTPHTDTHETHETHDTRLTHLYATLRERLPRLTKGKKLVAACLLTDTTPLTAQEIYNRVVTNTESAVEIDLATIYRNLEQLERVGVVEKIEFSASGWKFVLAGALSGASHGHSIRCVRCEHEVTMSECLLADVERMVAQRTGFNAIHHTVNFTGTCPTCQKAP